MWTKFAGLNIWLGTFNKWEETGEINSICYLTLYIQNILISNFNLCKKINICYSFGSCTKTSKPCIYYNISKQCVNDTYSASQVGGGIFQVFIRRILLVAIVLGSAALELSKI